MISLSRLPGYLVFAVLGALSLIAKPGTADELDNHPALARSPSPEEWQRRIAAAKRDEAEKYAAAREDFDLAIRSTELLGFNKPDDGPQWHVKLERESAGLFIREDMLDMKARDDQSEQTQTFWREHLEDLVVDDSPMLHVVLADALLNEWDDWSAWTGNDALERVKSKFPRVHRHCAWILAARYQVCELGGLALRWVRNPTPERLPENSDGLFADGVARCGRGIDTLDYLLRASALAREESMQRYLVCIALTWDNGDALAMRDAWAPYLTVSSIPIRTEAATRVGEMIRRIRSASKGQDNSDDLQARLRQLADTDADKEVRYRAKKALEYISATEWREDP